MPNVTGKCPICGAPADQKYHPFCSKHCADVDLGRWLKGVYVMHTDEKSDSETSVEQEEK